MTKEELIQKRQEVQDALNKLHDAVEKMNCTFEIEKQIDIKYRQKSYHAFGVLQHLPYVSHKYKIRITEEL